MEEDFRIPRWQLYAFNCCMCFAMILAVYAIIILTLSGIAFFVPGVEVVRDTIVNFVGTYIPCFSCLSQK